MCGAKHTLASFRGVLEPKSYASKSQTGEFFPVWKNTICYSAIYLPLGAATGPTAQSLLCAEFREKNRTFDNTGRGADTVRPGAQVSGIEI